MSERVLLSWSGGKDSLMALYELVQTRIYQVASLFTTITEDEERVGSHGVRWELIASQAASLGIPAYPIKLPPQPSNQLYESRLKEGLAPFQAQSLDRVAFGDLFLEDIRRYREQSFSLLGMRCLFPLWERDTFELSRQFVSLGFRAVVVCVDQRFLGPSFVGKIFDEDFLRRLPPGIDPCGENGEFHTFVFEGPLFSQKIRFSQGEITRQDDLWVADLLPEP